MSKFAHQRRPFGAADLRALRALLRLSQADMAELLGIADERSIRRIEREEIDPRTEKPHAISGPMQTALSYLQQGAMDELMRELLPEFITGDDMSLDRPWNYVIRLHYPRFIGILFDANEMPPGIEALDQIEMDDESLVIAMWIDPPGDRVRDVLRRAADQIERYTDAAERGEI